MGLTGISLRVRTISRVLQGEVHAEVKTSADIRHSEAEQIKERYIETCVPGRSSQHVFEQSRDVFYILRRSQTGILEEVFHRCSHEVVRLWFDDLVTRGFAGSKSLKGIHPDSFRAIGTMKYQEHGHRIVLPILLVFFVCGVGTSVVRFATEIRLS